MLEVGLIAVGAIIVAYVGLGFLYNKKYRAWATKRGRATRTWGNLIKDSLHIFLIEDKEKFESSKFASRISPRLVYIFFVVLTAVLFIIGQVAAGAMIAFAAIIFIVGRVRMLLSQRDAIITRMFEVSASEFKYPRGAELSPWSYIRVKKWVGIGVPGKTEIVFPASFRSDDPVKREGFENHFNDTVAKDNSWVYSWNGGQGIVLAKPVPPLPTMVTYPGSQDHSWDKFPVGVGRDGEVVWNVSDAPHILVCGVTGGGKSVAQSNIIYHCVQHSEHWRVLAIDVKMVELTRFLKYDNVVAGVATNVPDGLTIMQFAEQEMMERYELMKDNQVSHFLKLPNPPKALLVMIDEAYSFLATTNVSSDEGKELDAQKQEATILLGNIARLGRAAGVHLVVATQRPDAKVIYGEIKQNLPARYALGNMHSTPSGMVLDTNSATRIDGSAKGRGILSIHGTEKDVQGYFSEDDWLDKWLASQGETERKDAPVAGLEADITDMDNLDSDDFSDFGDDGPGAQHVPPEFSPSMEEFSGLEVEPAPESEQLEPLFTPSSPRSEPGEKKPVLSGGGSSRPPRMEDEWDDDMEQVFSYLPNPAQSKGAPASHQPPSAPMTPTTPRRAPQPPQKAPSQTAPSTLPPRPARPGRA